MSASLDRFLENVLVEAIVIPEFEFRNVQRITLTDYDDTFKSLFVGRPTISRYESYVHSDIGMRHNRKDGRVTVIPRRRLRRCHLRRQPAAARSP